MQFLSGYYRDITSLYERFFDVNIPMPRLYHFKRLRMFPETYLSVSFQEVEGGYLSQVPSRDQMAHKTFAISGQFPRPRLKKFAGYLASQRR
jgi:hypothetical protein